MPQRSTKVPQLKRPGQTNLHRYRDARTLKQILEVRLKVSNDLSVATWGNVIMYAGLITCRTFIVPSMGNIMQRGTNSKDNTEQITWSTTITRTKSLTRI